MHRSLILSGVILAASALQPAAAHAIFPGSQSVQTLGERAIVRFHAVNARKDVSNFVVEIFDADSWTPSRLAVAWPAKLNVPAHDDQDADAVERPFSVMLDLDGKAARRFRVCTKSVTPRDELRAKATEIRTRVCANVTVERFDR